MTGQARIYIFTRRFIHSSRAVQSSSIETSSKPRALQVPNLYRPNDAQSQGIVATVFGCTGFLGRYVVNQLANIGAQVITPYRGDGFNARHLKVLGELGQVVPIPFDMKDTESIQKAVARSNVVINLIGSFHQTNNYNFDDVHVKVSHRLAKISKEAGVERFIQMSTVAADPNSRSPWIRSKYWSEVAVRDFYPEATVFRAAPIYGVEDYITNLAVNCFKFPTNQMVIPMYNNGMGLIQPVYCVDVANAITNSLGMYESAGATYELGGDEVLTQKKLYEEIADAIIAPQQLRDRIRPVPYKLASAWSKFRDSIPTIPAFSYYWTNDMIEQWHVSRIVSSSTSSSSSSSASSSSSTSSSSSSSSTSSSTETLTLKHLGVKPTPFRPTLQLLMNPHLIGFIPREEIDPVTGQRYYVRPPNSQ